eukprot:scaffold32324_cov71-Phaeocystis_antarctica.AAC.4
MVSALKAVLSTKTTSVRVRSACSMSPQRSRSTTLARSTGSRGRTVLSKSDWCRSADECSAGEISTPSHSANGRIMAMASTARPFPEPKSISDGRAGRLIVSNDSNTCSSFAIDGKSSSP